MERLNEYPWDTRYSSSTHNLIKDFFIPALSRSRYYYRVAGYFSSTAIAAAARGISSFVENGEKMYLIVGSELSEEDVAAINKGIQKVDEIIMRKWEDCKKDFDKDFIKTRFEFLAWLVANNKLDIKIGINKDSQGKYLSSEKSKFHEKILIFEDYDGNMIQTDGSINETWKGWRENRESFCVHKSWIEGNEEFIKTAKEQFDKAWLNLEENCEVIDLPEALRKNLISFKRETKPSIDDDFNPEKEELSLYFPEKRYLRKYQEEAIQSWINHNYIGLLEMATGTGKTFTALNAIKRLNLKSKFLIIGSPQRELANQWAKECEIVFDSIPKRIIICYSGKKGSTDWKSTIRREMRQGYKDNSLCIIIVVYATMRKNRFLSEITKHSWDDFYLILDEVHELGSIKNSKIFLDFSKLKYRLGLSATPERIWDDLGNQNISTFFSGGPIFVWDLQKSINPPEGYERCLSEYKYYLHEASLNEKELAAYQEISLRIRQRVSRYTKDGVLNINDFKNDSQLEFLIRERAKMHKKCKNKYAVLKELLIKNSTNLKKCLIYCNDMVQMRIATDIILKQGLKCLQFFGDMDSQERDRVFQLFKEDDVKFLVAIKCLDQGIDLPVCDSAIILASSRNPREYVQRRGRILRLHKEKEFSIIHDIIVFPYRIEDLRSGKFKLFDFEAKLLENQIERIKIFTENSINKGENLLKIIDYGEIIMNNINQNG